MKCHRLPIGVAGCWGRDRASPVDVADGESWTQLEPTGLEHRDIRSTREGKRIHMCYSITVCQTEHLLFMVLLNPQESLVR